MFSATDMPLVQYRRFPLGGKKSHPGRAGEPEASRSWKYKGAVLNWNRASAAWSTFEAGHSFCSKCRLWGDFAEVNISGRRVSRHGEGDLSAEPIAGRLACGRLIGG